MKNLLLLLLSLFAFSFTSCLRDGPDYAKINYYLSASLPDDVESIELSFFGAKALTQTYARTIYLDSYNCTLKAQNEVSLGTSTIEAVQVEAFSFLFTRAEIYQNGLYRTISVGYRGRSTEVALEEDLLIEELDVINITFNLDLSASRIEFIDSVETLLPVFKAKISKE